MHGETVTVCIPAYRAGAFVAETLRAVQDQSHRDLRVEVAIDPATPWSRDGTRAAVEPFLADSRFHVRTNPRRLGWDRNIGALLARVTTPFYCVLPHDDLLDSRYVETLLAALRGRPDAGVAYADVACFGHLEELRAVDLPAEGARDERLFAFFLAGAEAEPWRGVTRTRVLERGGGFPIDGFGGFASECEYVLALLLQAPALRVAHPLYHKRISGPAHLTTAHSRLVEASRAERVMAWRRHRSRMLALLELCLDDPAIDAERLRIAAEVAMLRRFGSSLGIPLPAAEAERARVLARRVEALTNDLPEMRRVAAMLELVMSRHELASGRQASGTHHARTAAALDAASQEARQHLARIEAGDGSARLLGTRRQIQLARLGLNRLTDALPTPVRRSVWSLACRLRGRVIRP